MLVVATERGEAAYRTAIERQERWADDLTAGLSPEGFEAASALLREMQRRLDTAQPAPAARRHPQTQGA